MDERTAQLETSPANEESPRATLLRLTRATRRLLAAERDAGVTEMPGTAAPLTESEPAASAQAVRADASRGGVPGATRPGPARPGTARPGTARPGTARPDTVARAVAGRSPVVRSPAQPFEKRVPALDLPDDALAPFGELPARVAACTACRLCETRTTTVFGEGDAAARLVFCGEGPGFEEDRSGRPFVGRAGELLSKMIENGLKLRREQVFILNAVKCRPPENRTPAPDEIAACRPFLDAQLDVIAPTLIVALGNPATHALLGEVGGITHVRGRVFERNGVRVVPTFHPAYLLRNLAAKRDAWEDLKLVMRLLDEPT
jgi:DNA polymerase